VGIRDLFISGGPHSPASAEAWGDAVSVAADSGAAVMLWNETSEQYENGSGGTDRPDAGVVYWKGGPDPVDLELPFGTHDEWHVVGEATSAPTVSINEGPSSQGEVGGSTQLTVYVTGYPTPVLDWASDDELVATVTQTGYVEFVGEGEVTISVTATNTLGEDIAYHDIVVIAEQVDPPTADVISAEAVDQTRLKVTLVTPGTGGTSRTWHMGEEAEFEPSVENQIEPNVEGTEAVVTGLLPETTRYFVTVSHNLVGDTPSNEVSAETLPAGSVLMRDDFETESLSSIDGRLPAPTPYGTTTWAGAGSVQPAGYFNAYHADIAKAAYDMDVEADRTTEWEMTFHGTSFTTHIVVRGEWDSGTWVEPYLYVETTGTVIRLRTGSTTLATYSWTRAEETPYRLVVEDLAGYIKVWLDDSLIISRSTPENAGESWVGIRQGGGTSASVPRFYWWQVSEASAP
jgi:hypothetical protein